MLTIKGNLDINRPISFNIVNLNNESLIKLGLKPLYLKAYPRYINLSGNIFYNDPSHYECNLKNDISKILQIMNSNTYDRFEFVRNFLNDDHPIHFNIYNNQIFFGDLWSLSIYKNNLAIRNEINKKYNLPENFYEPTEKEILQDYSFQYLLKNREKYGTDIKYCTFNLTPQEYFDMMMLSKKTELTPFTEASKLDGNNIRHWLNYNANIFMEHKCSRNTAGVYNQETIEFINSLKETKLDIYNFFYHFSKQSKDWKKTVKELLIKLGVYTHLEPKEFEDPWNEDKYAELSHWNKMFTKASLDMLVQFVGFDKIESCLPNTVTTTKPNIYEEFFNLLVMDYNIVQLPKLIFDEENQQLRWINPKDFINTGINRECENEIKLIKKYVPYDERYKYLKN